MVTGSFWSIATSPIKYFGRTSMFTLNFAWNSINRHFARYASRRRRTIAIHNKVIIAIYLRSGIYFQDTYSIAQKWNLTIIWISQNIVWFRNWKIRSIDHTGLTQKDRSWSRGLKNSFLQHKPDSPQNSHFPPFLLHAVWQASLVRLYSSKLSINTLGQIPFGQLKIWFDLS